MTKLESTALARLAKQDMRGKSAAERRRIEEARAALAGIGGLRSNPVRTKGGRVLTPEHCETPTIEKLMGERAAARSKHQKMPEALVNADGTRCTSQSASLALHEGGGTGGASGKAGHVKIALPIGFDQTRMIRGT